MAFLAVLVEELICGNLIVIRVEIRRHESQYDENSYPNHGLLSKQKAANGSQLRRFKRRTTGRTEKL